ncbi:MAG TPA: flavodoxin domain-containing protein [Oscillospiraceae bacterium]|nr:flavodoxin domain-containing protein [Oscillospiraceae bacterium]HPF56423.1 flavodoxin domain-containing protein [Clostridiales bacterium]HPK36314.1 flavodoxin domain-containing protein [Oscillospiraceae bacterium]HPR76086.1 flavodoxin domain-containing protein [Oscillospiraceae bacterium]
MKAIIFTSNTGYTRKYAQILSQKTGFPAYELSQSKALLSELDEVVYMGWVMAGSVKGYKAAAKHYKIIAVCPVGMAPNDDGLGKQALEDFKQIGVPVFYLQGGFDMKKLRGMNKLMMKLMKNVLVKQINNKPDKTPEDDEMLKALDDGADFVKEENLTSVIDFIAKK